jgi:hypothetical protein
MHYLEEATIEALSTDPSVAGSRVAIGEQRHDDKQNPAMHLVSAPHHRHLWNNDGQGG